MTYVPSATTEAERALQVANVIRRIDRRMAQGHWQTGRRFGPGGDACLVGAIDESVRWTQPGVEAKVTEELALGLPKSLQIVARWDARIALMTYNDLPGGQRRVRRLLAVTLDRLGVPREIHPMPTPGDTAPLPARQSPGPRGDREGSALRTGTRTPW